MFFMQTDRMGFSKWSTGDLPFAQLLWGNPKVTKYICANGSFDDCQIRDRLNLEIENDKKHGIQYWPIFELSSHAFIGCCGLRPYGEETYEIGFHLRPEYWGRGYAAEAASRVMEYAFSDLRAAKLFAGHHPHNAASKKVLLALGFRYLSDQFYEPTGLYHPSYEIRNQSL